jgi:uncharacterized membrane protein
MSEHERTIDLQTAPEETFRYLSSLDNLPRFLPHISEIRLEEDSHVVAFADIDGKRYEMNGFFRPSPSERRIDWGSDGTPEYRGWLRVDSGATTHSSRLVVHISMRSAASEEPPPHPGLAGRRIEAQFTNVLDSIRHALEQEHAGAMR